MRKPNPWLLTQHLSTCNLSTILTSHKIENDIFAKIFTIRDRLIGLNKSETGNLKFLLNLNAEIDQLIKIAD
jgi:hypothetical protein